MIDPRHTKHTSESLQSDYSALGPDEVLHAVESCGFETSGRMLALNSYENRVYRVELEDDPSGRRFVVAKFYRPQRWSDATILEEHGFALELAEDEIPVVAPLLVDGLSLHAHGGYRFALYPLQGGRWPDLETTHDMAWMGRFIARIHNVGSKQPFSHRPEISIQRLGREPADYLQANGLIPSHIEAAYRTLTDDLLVGIESAFDRAGAYTTLRLHGDNHRGNILWTDDGPHFVDLDDCCSGPAIQDLWMLLSGERAEMTGQLCDLLEGYSDFADLDLRELHLVEALRTLRIMYYASWLAKRWDDPAFPLAFPWFNSTNYWEGHILELREQMSRLQEPVLVV